MRAALLASLLLACGSAPAADTSFGGPAGGPSELSTGSATSTGDRSSSSGSSSTTWSSTTASADAGSGTTTAQSSTSASDSEAIETTPGPVLGCGGKLDFVFVLSRSISQEKHQAAYLPALPVFINTILERFAAYDVHVLVTDTDSHFGDPSCGACDLVPGGCAEVPEYPCDLKPDKCDLTLGAGQTATAGLGAGNQRCTFASGKRWIELPGEPDPEGAFLCAAQVGWSYPSNGEQVGAALAAAGYIPCNLGFRRSDALLVITIISGPEDGYTPGHPYQWRQKLLQWVSGDEHGVVLLVLVDDSTEPGGGVCQGLVGPGRMKELADSLPYGRWASICAPAAPFFEENVTLVEEACALYIPQ